MVHSCSDCNNKSEEGLLKSFFSLFDERLAQPRLGKELLHPQGKGDLRSFVRICTPDVRVAYAEERVTCLLKKLFQGLRRHILKDRWTFLSAADFAVFRIGKGDDHQVIWPLPLCIGGPNLPVPVPPAFEIPDNLEHRFRDFHFGLLEADRIALRYGRTFYGNELVLCALPMPQPCEAPEERHSVSA